MASHWPLFDLRLRTPRLGLRVATEADLPGLVALARAGIHDPAEMPFATPWTDRPAPELEREFYRWYWRSQAEVTPERWHLIFVVRQSGDEAPLGIQALEAKDFPSLRSFLSGSWLGRAHQGQGFGKEMRAAVLHLGFETLGARVATSGSFVDNAASEGVSRAMGYEKNGVDLAAPRGEPRDVVRWRLTRQRWQKLRDEGRYPEVSVEGAEGTLDVLGLTP